MTDAGTITPTAALLTPRGRGAVATVRFLGDCRAIDRAPPLFQAANGRPLHQQPLDRIVFGQWGSDVGEDVVVCRTGEDATEIHCHGGQAAAAAILNDLESRGCRTVSGQQQIEQQSGRFDAECLEALTRATTTRTADRLLEQHSGVLRREIERIRQLTEDNESAETAITQLDALLHWADFGLHLSRPWEVVIAGRPNVGKSSLINALVGFPRSIVFDRPGTTRDVVTAETAFDGWPVRLSDTAGLREAGDDIEIAGMQRARLTLSAADCQILLFDTSRPPHQEDRKLLSAWPDAIRIAHKCDLPNVWQGPELASALPVSSVTGAGLEPLARLLIDRLVPHIPQAGTPFPVCPRHVNLLQRARKQVLAGNLSAAGRTLDELLD